MLDRLFQESELQLQTMKTLASRLLSVPLNEVPRRADLAEELHDLLVSLKDRSQFMALLVSLADSDKTAEALREAYVRFYENGHTELLRRITRHDSEIDESLLEPVDLASLGPPMPQPPADFNQLVPYLQQVYAWLRGELENLFEEVPPALLEHLPPPGSRYLFENWSHIASVTQRVKELANFGEKWQLFQKANCRNWYTEDVEISRFNFLWTACQRYSEIVAPTPSLGL